MTIFQDTWSKSCDYDPFYKMYLEIKFTFFLGEQNCYDGKYRGPKMRLSKIITTSIAINDSLCHFTYIRCHLFYFFSRIIYPFYKNNELFIIFSLTYAYLLPLRLELQYSLFPFLQEQFKKLVDIKKSVCSKKFVINICYYYQIILCVRRYLMLTFSLSLSLIHFSFKVMLTTLF